MGLDVRHHLSHRVRAHSRVQPVARKHGVDGVLVRVWGHRSGRRGVPRQPHRPVEAARKCHEEVDVAFFFFDRQAVREECVEGAVTHGRCGLTVSGSPQGEHHAVRFAPKLGTVLFTECDGPFEARVT